MTTQSDYLVEVRTRVSANLKRVREETGLSQEELADRAGVHRTYVSKIERRVVNYSLDSLAALAFALGVDVEVFFRLPG